MSLFGYPAKVIHYHIVPDAWGRVQIPADLGDGYNLEDNYQLINAVPVEKNAKVIEEQKLIRVASKVGQLNVYSTEEVLSVAEIHLEGMHEIGVHDVFLYTNNMGEKVQYKPKHIEIKKTMGTDEVKKVIVYA